MGQADTDEAGLAKVASSSQRQVTAKLLSGIIP